MSDKIFGWLMGTMLGVAIGMATPVAQAHFVYGECPPDVFQLSDDASKCITGPAYADEHVIKECRCPAGTMRITHNLLDLCSPGVDRGGTNPITRDEECRTITIPAEVGEWE